MPLRSIILTQSGLVDGGAEERDNPKDRQASAKNPVTVRDRANRDCWVWGWNGGWCTRPHRERRQYLALAMVCRPCLRIADACLCYLRNGLKMNGRWIVVGRWMGSGGDWWSEGKLPAQPNWSRTLGIGATTPSVQLRFSRACILWIDRSLFFIFLIVINLTCLLLGVAGGHGQSENGFDYFYW